MSLRTRVAIAVGVVVFGALAIVAAVVYPAVGANLRGQNDNSLVHVAKAPQIAAKLKQARTAGSWSRSATRSCSSCPMPRSAPPTGSSASPTRTRRSPAGTHQPYFPARPTEP